MSCQNCLRLEKRIQELLVANHELESQRSRERTRLAEIEKDVFFRSLNVVDADRNPTNADFIELLELLNRVVENPHGETLQAAKSQLEKYLV
jgi:hypothetical protein